MEENIEIKSNENEVEKYTNYPTSDGDLMYEKIKENFDKN